MHKKPKDTYVTYPITLSNGLLFNKKLIKVFYIRELNGYDEQFLMDIKDSSSTRTIELLLSRILILDNGYYNKESINKNLETTLISINDADNLNLISNMTIGDRNSILLYFRRIMFGNTIQCNVRCQKCHESITFDLSISNLLSQELKNPQKEYKLNDTVYNIDLRPLKGEHQNFLINNSETLTLESLTSYLLQSFVGSSNPSLPEKLPIDLFEKILNQLEFVDPLFNIVVDVRCSLCNDSFLSPLCISDFIFEELQPLTSSIYNEVHWLALYYHWSEDDILSLPTKRRKRYLNLLDKTFSKASNL